MDYAFDIKYWKSLLIPKVFSNVFPKIFIILHFLFILMIPFQLIFV